MRYLVGVIVFLISVPTVSAGDVVIASAARQASQIAISLVIADPCQNTLHATHAMCSGKATYRAVESTQLIYPVSFTSTGDNSVEVAAVPYRVRTIDFY